MVQDLLAFVESGKYDRSVRSVVLLGDALMLRWDKAPRPRGQTVMFEPTLDKMIAGDHPVRLFDEILAAQDWSDWESPYVLVAGRPPIPPRVLASILLYGLSQGIRSSRRLEYACRNSLDFIWLAEGREPDHSTLCGFRKRLERQLKALFGAICRMALDLGLAALNQVALDGTRVRANSSRHTTATAATLEERLAALREHIERLRLPRKLADLERRQALLEQALAAAKAKDKKRACAPGGDALKAKEAAEGGNGGHKGKKPRAPRVPVADPESTVQPNKDGGYAPNYTPMAAVETKGGFIVDADVLADADEGSVTVSTVDRIATTYGEGPGQLLADSAHGSGENLAALAQRGVEGYIPPPRRGDGPAPAAARADPSQALPPDVWPRLPRNSRKMLDRRAFVYDRAAEVYWCPLGRRLTLAGEHAKHGRPYRRYRAENSCRGCPLQPECTTSKEGRRLVYRDRHEDLRETMDARLSTAAGRATYGRRAPVVEAPFGHIKTQMHLRQFLLRGLAGVRTEWLWVCTAYNLSKLVRALAGGPGTLADLLKACVAVSRRVLAAWGVYGRHGSLGRLWRPSGWLKSGLSVFGRHRFTALCAA